MRGGAAEFKIAGYESYVNQLSTRLVQELNKKKIKVKEKKKKKYKSSK
jgi:hypothetical protein